MKKTYSIQGLKYDHDSYEWISSQYDRPEYFLATEEVILARVAQLNKNVLDKVYQEGISDEKIAKARHKKVTDTLKAIDKLDEETKALFNKPELENQLLNAVALLKKSRDYLKKFKKIDYNVKATYMHLIPRDQMVFVMDEIYIEEI